MNIIIVDDEQPALNAMKRALLIAAPASKATEFLYADEALVYAGSENVDVAFLDIEMSEINGLQLAKRLKELNGKTNIIFVTGYSQYALQAFSISASGYIIKPIDPSRVAVELENLRYGIDKADKGIRVQCFGNFEVFVDGKPAAFRRPKAKEALAYLVDRKGANVSKKALASVLWEDKAYTRSIQSHLYKLIEEIEYALSLVNAQSIFIKSSGYYRVDVNKFACDYYEFEKGNARAVNAYQGEYMNEYCWGEFTIGYLDRKV